MFAKNIKTKLELHFGSQRLTKLQEPWAMAFVDISVWTNFGFLTTERTQTLRNYLVLISRMVQMPSGNGKQTKC